MIRLKQLYSEPEVFTPIYFESGINIILGEKSEKNNKTNGVGKSICIEFLNFCLLKQANSSRVLRIPHWILKPDTKIKLDLDLNDHRLTIIRTTGNPELISILIDGKEIIFNKLDDASEYLGNLYFKKLPPSVTRLSFRNLLAPILRDERSEFKDIIKYNDTAQSIPRDYKPHLFFLDLDINLYSEIKKIIDDLEKKTVYFGEINKLLTNNKEITISDAKAKLNELESEVSKINKSVENLKNNTSFDSIQNDLIKIQSNLDELRTKQQAIKHEIKQITFLSTHENISEHEITILFNQFKKGLGDIVKKSLDEVRLFRNKIDEFRNTLINKKLKNLNEELLQINTQLEKFDNDYSEKIKLIDNNGDILKDLKTSINIFSKKNEELNNLRALIDRYEITNKEKKNLKSQKTTAIEKFDLLIEENNNIIKNFEETILQIHEKIIGNRTASFEIKTIDKAQKKEFLDFNLRTDDDGSHGTERTKVFIYDMALMFNKHTKKNHPSFLVHDNIFNVDDDALEKSLNFLYYQERNHPEEFQYILTLNIDMVDTMEARGELKFKINDYKRATFTKDKRFMRNKYTENKEKK